MPSSGENCLKSPLGPSFFKEGKPEVVLMRGRRVTPYLIYPLYRLRWQIELIFKACKNSLNANAITSCDENIIESLLLASIAAHLSAHTVFKIGTEQLDEAQQLATSFQRVAKVAVVLARDFVMFLLHSSQEHFVNLVDKIKLFTKDIFDPNYKNRETSLARIQRLLLEGET